MSLNLKSSGGGSVTVDVPSTASDYTATLPAANITVVGTSSAVSAAGQIPFSTDGSTFTPTAKIVSGTSVTASGTSVNFTDIPSWVKRITVMFSGVSTSGTSPLQIQLGDAGGIETTGYASSGGFIQQSTTYAGVTNSTAGFLISAGAAAANLISGGVSISLLNLNNWTAFGTVTQQSTPAAMGFTAGSKTLSDTITTIRITTVNGTDTFDAGSINILYE